MIEPHRGAFVHGLDEDAVHDHYDVFGLIFGLTARRATERASDEAIADLVAAHRRLKRPTDSETFRVANNEYLRQLFAMAASPRLASLSRLLRNIVPGNFFEAVPGAMANQKRGMAAVTKAVRARDGELAERECRTMMRSPGRRGRRPAGGPRPRPAVRVTTASRPPPAITDEAVAKLRSRIGIPEPHPQPPHYRRPGHRRLP